MEATFQIRFQQDQSPVMVTVDAQTARRRVTSWAISQVATSCGGGTPELTFEDQRVKWQVPVIFTRQHSGTVGEIGFVIVDAQSGDLNVSDVLARQMQVKAAQLAQTFERDDA